MKRLTLVVALVLIGLTASVTILSSLAGWLPWHLQVMTGQTMEPAIANHSLLVTVRQPAAEFPAGTVVAYRWPGQQMAVARIVRLANQGGDTRYTLQADAAPAEYTVSSAAILGKVRYHWRLVAPIYQFLRSWPGLVLGLYLPAVGLAAREVNRLAQELAQISLE